MCFDPITLVATGLTAAGSIASASAESSSYEARAKYAQRQSEMSLQKGAYDAAQLKRQNDKQLASMRGQYLSSGIALSGSALDVMQDSATQASMDEQSVLYGAQVQSDNFKFDAELARANASSARTGGYLGALATGVNSFTSSKISTPQRTVISNPFTEWGRAQRGEIQGLF